MSQYGLSTRGRAMSHASIRKRLLRSSSEQKKQISKNTTAQEFRPKLQRLLQQNKITFIMNTDPHTKANLFYTTHINQMQKQLSSAKKSLSTMVMKTKSKQSAINILKNDIAKIERQQAILRGQSLLNKTKLSSMAHQLDRKKDSLEDKLWVEKSYQHIKSRLEKDQEFLKTQHAYTDRDFKQLQNQRKILDNNLLQLTQLNQKLAYNLFQAKKINKQQTDEKNEFIQLLNLQMAEKDMLNDLKIEKINREGEIKDLMPSVIEKQQLQKYMHILFTHKLLGQIIKKKSQKLIEKYHKVQSAYLHIKSNTNILQLPKILARMQTQDHQYQNLLKKVDSLQCQLVDQQQQMQNLTQKQHQILSKDTQEHTTVQVVRYQGKEKDAYQILAREKMKLMERRSEDDILKKKIVLWVQEHCVLFEINSKIKKEEDVFTQLKLLQASIKKRLENK